MSRGNIDDDAKTVNVRYDTGQCKDRAISPVQRR